MVTNKYLHGYTTIEMTESHPNGHKDLDKKTYYIQFGSYMRSFLVEASWRGLNLLRGISMAVIFGESAEDRWYICK